MEGCARAESGDSVVVRISLHSEQCLGGTTLGPIYRGRDTHNCWDFRNMAGESDTGTPGVAERESR